jgi:hypothetical protein
MFHRSRKFCKLFLTTADTTPNFGHGLRVAHGYLEEDFSPEIAPAHRERIGLRAQPPGTPRMAGGRNPWAAGDYILPRLRRLMRFTPLEIRECTFCVGHEPFLKRVDQTIQGSASDGGCHIQLVRYSDACRYSDKPVEQKGKAKGHSRSTSARARFASVAKGS